MNFPVPSVPQYGQPGSPQDHQLQQQQQQSPASPGTAYPPTASSPNQQSTGSYPTSPAGSVSSSTAASFQSFHPQSRPSYTSHSSQIAHDFLKPRQNSSDAKLQAACYDIETLQFLTHQEIYRLVDERKLSREVCAAMRPFDLQPVAADLAMGWQKPLAGLKFMDELNPGQAYYADHAAGLKAKLRGDSLSLFKGTERGEKHSILWKWSLKDNAISRPNNPRVASVAAWFDRREDAAEGFKCDAFRTSYQNRQLEWRTNEPMHTTLGKRWDTTTFGLYEPHPKGGERCVAVFRWLDGQYDRDHAVEIFDRSIEDEFYLVSLAAMLRVQWGLITTEWAQSHQACLPTFELIAQGNGSEHTYGKPTQERLLRYRQRAAAEAAGGHHGGSGDTSAISASISGFA